MENEQKEQRQPRNRRVHNNEAPRARYSDDACVIARSEYLDTATIPAPPPTPVHEPSLGTTPLALDQSTTNFYRGCIPPLPSREIQGTRTQQNPCLTYVESSALGRIDLAEFTAAHEHAHGTHTEQRQVGTGPAATLKHQILPDAGK